MAGRLSYVNPLAVTDCLIRLGNGATYASSMLLLDEPVILE